MIIRQVAPGLGENDESWIIMFMMVIPSHTRPHSFGITWKPPMIPWGILAPLLLLLLLRVCTSLRPIFMGSIIPYSIRAYNKFPVPSGKFWLSPEYSMVIVSGKYRTHTKHGSSNSISFQITGSISCKLQYMEWDTCYNLQHRLPNYNKMLIYNLLCCFATRVVYAWVTVTCVKV